MSRKRLSFEEIEAAIKQKRIMIENQNGLCFVCGKPFTDSNPAQMSHRIIQRYREVYGTEIIDHPDNTPICHKTCNSSVILDPYKQSGKDHIESIKNKISDNEIIQQVMDRR